MERNEHLQSKELLNFHSFAQEAESTELTREDAETIFTERTHMLDSIKNVISKHMHEALSIKIEQEKKTLLDMVTEDETTRETHQKRNKVLDYTYFKKKTLNLKRM